jgi:predicted RNA binding protein YcfA (HicA-like mRNA interferase family)
MGVHDKLLEKILRGTSDANIAFEDLCQLLRHLGFDERTRGSHHLFRKSGITELINLQRAGSKAKVYQVRQVRAVLLTYRLAGEGDED